jgi:hypothetical protein
VDTGFPAYAKHWQGFVELLGTSARSKSAKIILNQNAKASIHSI